MKRNHQITALMLSLGLALAVPASIQAQPEQDQGRPRISEKGPRGQRGPGRHERSGRDDEGGEHGPRSFRGGPEGGPEGRPGPRGGFRGGPEGGPEDGPEGGPREARAFWRNEELSAAIKLTPEQKETLEKAYTENESANKKLRDELDDLHETQRTALQAETVNESEVLARVDEISSRAGELRKLQLKQRLLAQSTLTAEQKKDMKEYLRQQIRTNFEDRREFREDRRAQLDERGGRGPRARGEGRGRGPRGPEDQPMEPPMEPPLEE